MKTIYANDLVGFVHSGEFKIAIIGLLIAAGIAIISAFLNVLFGKV